MDLKNGNITLGELLSHPGARSLLEREAPGALSSPLIRRFRNVTLNQAVALLRGRIPDHRIRELTEELRKL